MYNSFEQQDFVNPFNINLAEINNEYDNEYDENSEYNLSSDFDRSFNPNNFFGHNDCFNFISNNHNTFINSRIETNENTNLRNNIISSRVFSGRKRKKENENSKKIHNKYSEDNILRKINVHFLNFIILFLNEILSKFNIKDKKDKFIDINGQYKKLINNKNFNTIKNETIAQILSNENNKKYINKYKNRELLNKIQNSNNEILKRTISKSYIYIFQEVYYKNKKKINYEGLELNLPKTIGDFLEKAKKGDILYKEKIEKVIRKYYYPKIFEIDNEKA